MYIYNAPPKTKQDPKDTFVVEVTVLLQNIWSVLCKAVCWVTIEMEANLPFHSSTLIIRNF